MNYNFLILKAVIFILVIFDFVLIVWLDRRVIYCSGDRTFG